MPTPWRRAGGPLFQDAPERASRASSASWLVVRLLCTGFLLLDSGYDSLTRLAGHDWVGAAFAWLMFVGGILCCWRPRWGAWVLGAVILFGVLHAPAGGDLSLMVIAPAVLVPRLTRRGGLALAALLAAYGVVVALRFSDTPSTDIQVRLVFTGIGFIVGIAARTFILQNRAGLERIAQLERENQQIRADERNALARELHDVVAHQLSIISLQIMGHRDSADPDELRGALDRVDDASRAALGELQLLVRMLREEGTEDEPLDRLARVGSPTSIGQELDRTLAEQGFAADIEIAPAADELEPSELLTVSRVLQEATTNILRHAPSGSTVSVSVDVDDTSVRLRVANPLPLAGRRGPLHDHSLGLGLRGIRERVDLIGGTITVGRRDGNWVVDMSLPRASTRRETEPTRLMGWRDRRRVAAGIQAPGAAPEDGLQEDGADGSGPSPEDARQHS